jgi:arylsulfatase A-like enzyme
MKPTLALLAALLLAPLAALSAADAPAKKPDAVSGNRPNFVLIVADDLGYGSLGCYGSKQVRTPHIDRLAADGMRFSDYHANSPYCSPTRAAMLTGRYQQRCAWVDDALLSPVYREQRQANLKQRFAWGLDPAEVTLPEVLRGAGYRTGLIGKWHLGYDHRFNPLDYGFDEFRGYIGGAVDYHTHRARFGQRELDWWNGKQLEDEPGYATDLLTGYAVEFIARHRARPFLLWLCYGAPHVPLQGRAPRVPKSPSETYLEMIETLDEGVGRVRQALRENGLEQNTLLVFCSDNGADHSRGLAANGPLKGLKGELSEGGHRVPCVACWPGRIAAGSLCGQTAMGMDWFATFAGLACTSIPKGLQSDGVNLLDILTQRAELKDRALHWLLEDRWAVREGPWKLLGRGSQPQELYHLVEDLGEEHNVLVDRPDFVRQLQQKHEAWLADVHAQRKQTPELKAALPQSPAEVYDLVVYGDSAAAVTAAVQAKRLGLSVVLVNSDRFLGGMTCSGLSASDINNRSAVGGIALELYRRIGRHYGKEYVDYFEPHVAQEQINALVAEAQVPVEMNEQLDRKAGLKKDGQRITSITMLSGKTYRGRMFMDASYTGDLMAAAGVSYTVGREPNSQYGETINGMQRGDTTPRTHYTQRDKDHFIRKVDPYIKPGDPASGLLPHIYAVNPVNGEGDRRIQAYNYRLCLTDDPANRLPIEKPAGYREADHELLLRNLEAGDHRFPALIHKLPQGKVDWNSMHAVGTDYVGANWDYPEADYPTRQRIEKEHELYIRGHLWTLANHSRVPEAIRKQAASYGLCKDEFRDNGGWPPMIYVREARRMVSDYVMTEADCKGKRSPSDPVALASFGMDSHAVRYFVTAEGFAQRDGVIWQVPPRPYGISYRSIVPRDGECENLLVPVCLSATHVAHGSIRMEPVFMGLGQAAAAAAAIALEDRQAVQKIAYQKLRARLEADGLPVAWKPIARAAGTPPAENAEPRVRPPQPAGKEKKQSLPLEP